MTAVVSGQWSVVRKYATRVALALGVGLALVNAKSCHQEAIEKAKMATTIKLLDEKLAEKDAQIAELRAERVTRNEQAAVDKAEIDRQTAKVQTLEQAMARLEKRIPELKAEPFVEVPDAPSAILNRDDPENGRFFSKREILLLDRYGAECEKQAVDLKTCKQDLGGVFTELLLTEGKVTDKDRQLKAAKAAANGGTRWQRTTRVLKPIACATAGAGIGSLIGKHKGAVIGAGAGGVGCAIF